MCDLLAFQQELASAIDMPARGAVGVYRNTVMLGAVDSLADNYPVVRRLVGPEMFDAMAVDHATCCPPRSPVMALYGARFSDWIGDQPFAIEIPYLADVARIERLFVKALFAADEPVAALEDFQGTNDWTQMRIRLHPATQFDWFTSPAMTIWLAHQQQDEPILTADWAAEGALFTRPGNGVEAMAIDRASHRFLFGLRLGETAGAAALATAALYPAADIGALFAKLVHAGAFAAPSSRRN